MTGKTIPTTLAAAIGACCLLGASAEAASTARFAHMNSPDHFVNVAGEAMASAIAERTGGEVDIQMFPSGQLGENSQITEQIALGSAMIGQVGAGTIASYVPDYGIIIYPFMYADVADAEKLLASELIGDIEAEVESEHNIKVLCYFAFGIRDLYTRDTEVREPADAAGLKMRVQPVPLYTEMVKQVFGAAPTSLPWPEVYSAFAQGVIDAAEAPPAAILDQKHHEHAGYLMQTNHILDLSPVIVSAAFFDGLLNEHQVIVQEEADGACASMTETALSGYEAGLAELEASGMTIVADVDKAAFAERAGGIAAAFPDWSDGLYERARAVIDGE